MSYKEQENKSGKWEEVVMMMELPNGANLNISKKNLYLQVAGMWTDKPVVKLDNMLHVGNVSETVGSHVFVEIKDGDDVQQPHGHKENEREICTAQTNLTLKPIHLQNKTDRIL